MLAGKATELSFVARKAFCPMVSNPSEKVTALRFSHPRKALSPIVFTLEGIDTEIRDELWKA